MADSWDAAKAAAVKVLGKQAKIPEPKAMAKADADLQKAYAAFDKSREDLEDKLVTLQNADSAIGNVYKQFGTLVEKADFGLDAKNKDDAKKIEQAKKILSAYVDKVTDAQEQNVKNLTELDKHVILLSKYKPAA